MRADPVPPSLTSEPDRFSDDAWDLLLATQDTARRWRHGAMDVEHLLQTLLLERRFASWLDPLPLDPDRLLDRLESFCVDQPGSSGDALYIGDALEDLLEDAERCRAAWGSPLLDVSHLLMALVRDPRIGAALLGGEGLSEDLLLRQFRPGAAVGPATSTLPLQAPVVPASPPAVLPASAGLSDAWIDTASPAASLPSPPSPSPPPAASSELRLEQEPPEPSALERYGRDLTAAARAGELDPVIGRDLEMRRLIQVLSRRSKNNPVLIGEPGVGKTAVAELLAQRIVTGEVPDSLQGLRLVALDLGALIAGAKFRGQFEERLRSVLKEVRDADGVPGAAGVVLFIDELHTVVSNDRSNADAGSVLKPALAQGYLRCIGATTPEEYRRSIEKDPALDRRFQQVLIKEPGLDTSVEILRGLKERYELHHGVAITDQALVAAARLADRYITDRCLPDSAIDLVDEAAAQLRMEVTSKPQLVEAAEAELRRVELALLSAEAAPLEERVQWQDQRRRATEALQEVQQRWQAERERLAELRDLLQQDEDLRHAIGEAERQGDYEEAARLQHDQLNGLQQRRETLEAELQGETILREQVEEGDIADVVARWTGIPVQRLLAGERQKLLELEARLGERVIGQPEAVAAVAAAIRRARAGMQSPTRPVGSFLFLGPTGVGKTELAKALAASLFDEDDALVRLDMSEFMERNAVARLVGAPPGYVGYEEGGQLTEAVRRRPYAVLLLDEVEKAHPEVFNLLLQVLDDGRLTDSQGRTVDFRHTVVIMTSNLASRAILENARAGADPALAGEQEARLAQQVDQALSAQFRPEFLNRIDEVIRFRPLGPADLQRIVRLQLAELARLLAEQHLALEVPEPVVQALAEQGYEPEYGARPLRRVLRRQLENPLATELLAERFAGARGVRVEAGNPFTFVPLG
ncbi:AAA family ATPase [Cyanobium sp. T1B-Tous]|uniref:ATP-dependent Clp protease ATP-binding subunit n=1 Tax=Cyanobium sp. T1B-Tous TaxID=2823721 RepID=UPI0020CE4B9E|nr:AAA family ATPase [Cyanobium sp. T1B-Tous]MCP9807057.1 AAA family ATPase [Cyanobium sp. T1B-Tous]